VADEVRREDLLDEVGAARVPDLLHDPRADERLVRPRHLTAATT
jgi:hypothetical protein